MQGISYTFSLGTKTLRRCLDAKSIQCHIPEEQDMNQYSAACNSLCLSPELVPGAVAPLEAEDPGIQRNQPGPKKYNTADPLKG